MKKLAFVIACACAGAASLFAAPSKGPAYEPVAEGYCAWAGLTEANYVTGRHLVPSDLRHKFAVVVFVDAKEYEKQLLAIAPGLQRINARAGGEGTAAEAAVLPRDKICLVVLVGKADAAKVREYLKSKTKELSGTTFYIYSNVTGSKVPDAEGKYPFYCAFGSEPGEPLASGAFDAKKIGELANDPKNRPEGWKPYRGTIDTPKHMKSFDKILASGKPLDPLMASCLKGVTAKDAEKAKECQILYDALAQTCSDYLFSIETFATTAPTRAYYEAQIVMKRWPKTKKQMKTALDKIAAIPDIAPLIKMFANLKKWGAEDFMCKNAAEAKKIEAELKKMKTTCDAMIDKKGASPVVVSAAGYIAYEAENLAPLMSSKVPVK